jgi:hypothetical protein
MPEYVRQERIPWPVAVDVDEKTVGLWQVNSYPSVYLIDRQGNLRIADIYARDLERAVKSLLDESNAP